MKVDIVHVKRSKVECTGTKASESRGSSVAGHPKVYLYVGNQARCPYCGKIFVLDK